MRALLAGQTGPWACAKRNEIRKLQALARERAALGDLEGAKQAEGKASRMRAFYEINKPRQTKRLASVVPVRLDLTEEKATLMEMLRERECSSGRFIRYWELVNGAVRKGFPPKQARAVHLLRRRRFMDALEQLIREKRVARINRLVLSCPD